MNQADHVVELVDDYLHGVLAPMQASQVEQHCEQCKICATALDEARIRYDAYRSLPPCEASGKLVQQTLEAIDDDRNVIGKARSAGKWSLVLATAASIALLIAANGH